MTRFGTYRLFILFLIGFGRSAYSQLPPTTHSISPCEVCVPNGWNFIVPQSSPDIANTISWIFGITYQTSPNGPLISPVPATPEGDQSWVAASQGSIYTNYAGTIDEEGIYTDLSINSPALVKLYLAGFYNSGANSSAQTTVPEYGLEDFTLDSLRLKGPYIPFDGQWHPVVIHIPAGNHRFSFQPFNSWKSLEHHHEVLHFSVAEENMTTLENEIQYQDTICLANPCMDFYFPNLPQVNNPQNITWTFEGAVEDTPVNMNPMGICYSDTGRYQVWLSFYDGETQYGLDMGTVTVLADQKGCRGTELSLPNIITPNQDGINEFFVIDQLEQLPENELQVFNRWGNSVFSQKNYQNNWSGEDLVDGIYFYVLKSQEKVLYQGFVHLLR